MKIEDLQPIEQIENIDLDENEQHQNYSTQSKGNNKKKKNTGGKVAKRVVSAVLVLSLAAGSVYVYKEIRKKMEQTAAEERANSIASMYQVGNVCNLDEHIYSSKNYDTKICDGQTLVNTLNEKGIQYCEILDEYYTKDGRNIAIVTLEVEHTERITPAKIVDETKGVTYYTAPEGYELVNGYCQKITTDTRTIITEVREDKTYVNIKLDGVTVKKVISVDIVNTKSYDEIISSDFVCDVKDDYAQHLNGQLSEASYRLIPKRN